MKVIEVLSLVFIALILLCSLLFFGWWAMNDHFALGDRRFDQVQWVTAQATLAQPCYRGDMAFDLKQRVLSRGMPRPVVTALLGRPTWEDSGQIEYELGTCLWHEYGLRLYFDQHDRLIRSRIVQH